MEQMEQKSVGDGNTGTDSDIKYHTDKYQTVADNNCQTLELEGKELTQATNGGMTTDNPYNGEHEKCADNIVAESAKCKDVNEEVTAKLIIVDKPKENMIQTETENQTMSVDSSVKSLDMEQFVSDLTDKDLKIKLTSLGVDVAPITPMTRKIYKKILLRKLTKNEENPYGEEDSSGDEDTKSTSPSENHSVNDVKSMPDYPQSFVFFAIAVPSDSEQFQSPGMSFKVQNLELVFILCYLADVK